MSALAPQSSSIDRGLMRSAALMRALGPDGNSIWAELNSEETRALSHAMDLFPMDAQDNAKVLDQFVQSAKVTNSLPTTPAEEFAAFLSAVDVSRLAGVLSREHPQTIAVVLSCLSGGQAAQLVSSMPRTVSVEAMKRLLHLKPVHPGAIDTIRQRLSLNLEDVSLASGEGHNRLANILDMMDSRVEQELLSALDRAEPGASEKVRALMFTFMDLCNLDSAGIQTVLSRTDRKILAYALKGAPEKVGAIFYQNMTSRAGEVLREEIEALGPVRRSDIETARQEMTALAKFLVQSGEIRLRLPATDEDELVE